MVASFGYEKYLSIEGAKDILGFTFKYREDPIFLDPRNKHLGARLIINLEKLYLSLKKLDLKNDKIENYHIHSHKLGIVPKDLNKLKNKLTFASYFQLRCRAPPMITLESNCARPTFPLDCKS